MMKLIFNSYTKLLDINLELMEGYIMQHVLDDPNIIQINKLPARSYYIPRTAAGDENNEQLSLNGLWRFNYQPDSRISTICLDDSTLDVSNWNKIEVPGQWQMQGYGRPEYTNIQYPFIINIPYTPAENPTGYYVRDFELVKMKARNYFVRFEGVDNAFYVWINGKQVGFYKGSRTAAEFDITEYVRDGNNTIAVQVYQWSASSYIEDQDMWWLTGIFRDVSILNRPQNFIWDYFYHTKFDHDYSQVKFTLDLETFRNKNLTVHILLLDDDNQVVIDDTQKICNQVTLSYQLSNPKLWNAEQPRLYQLVIATEEEKIKQRIGFREVKEINNLICINGTPITFKGVNRHEFHEKFGRTVPRSRVIQELKLMKDANINAIRCSHYPEDPIVYELCDQYGFYMIDEADVECHGVYATGDVNRISSDPEWSQSYIERMESMIERDKNFAAVIIWSVGNESGNGTNHQLEIEWARQRDSSRLIHHEGEFRYARVNDQPQDVQLSDMNSSMYPSIAELKAVAENSTIVKPYILCEYAHQMGNGAGSLQDYWDTFRQYPQLQGGFIWEWKDHGILRNHISKNGDFAYGGDFGEVPNDYNFVIDGIIQPDLKPSPSFYDVQAVYSPIQLKLNKLEKPCVEITNEYNFTTISSLEVIFTIKNEAEELLSEKQKIVNLKPGEMRRLVLTKSFEELLTLDAALVLLTTVCYYDRATAATKKVTKSHLLKTETFDKRKIASSNTFENVDSKQAFINLYNFDDKQLQVNHKTGDWQIIKLATNQVLIKQPESIFWRALTDNDFIVGQMWRKAGLDRMLTNLRDLNIRQSHNTVELSLGIACGPAGQGWFIKNRINYLFRANGEIKISVSGKPIGNYPETLPRIGLQFEEQGNDAEVSWLGRGPYESYPDINNGTWVDYFKANCIADLNFDYIFPQENGNHSDTNLINVLTSNKNLLTFTNDVPFNFSVKQTTITALDEAQHSTDLNKMNDKFLIMIDYRQNGIGSRSCGPEPLDKYLLKMETYTFGIDIKVH